MIKIRVYPGHWKQVLTFTCSNTWTEILSNLWEYCCTCKHSHWPQPVPLLSPYSPRVYSILYTKSNLAGLQRQNCEFGAKKPTTFWFDYPSWPAELVNIFKKPCSPPPVHYLQCTLGHPLHKYFGPLLLLLLFCSTRTIVNSNRLIFRANFKQQMESHWITILQ